MMAHNNPELCLREMAVKGIKHGVYRRRRRQAVRLHRDMGAAIVGPPCLGKLAKRLQRVVGVKQWPAADRADP